MRRLNGARLALLFALSMLVATVAGAQGTGRLNGEVKDKEGKPYADVKVEIKNPDTGQAWDVTTDSKGKFVQVGLRTGMYTISMVNEKDGLHYSEKFPVKDGQENDYSINFKELIASQAAANAAQAKESAENEDKFKNMKAHFAAGKAAMEDSDQVRAQWKTAPADQKAALQDKMNADYQTAITEYKAAEEGVPAKDTKNHALVWANLGQAYELAGRYDDAVAAFRKAVELGASTPFYEHLTTNLVNAAAASTDPKVTDALLEEASTSCEKAGALDPASGAKCYKNIGIILSNKNRLKEAVAPLQKATQVDPKDAQTWFLLGGALSATIDTKQQGEKIVYIIPPGTADAYQKCIDAAPTGPYAVQAKAMLDGLAQMSGGEDTTISRKKKKN